MANDPIEDAAYKFMRAIYPAMTTQINYSSKPSAAIEPTEYEGRANAFINKLKNICGNIENTAVDNAYWKTPNREYHQYCMKSDIEDALRMFADAVAASAVKSAREEIKEEIRTELLMQLRLEIAQTKDQADVKSNVNSNVNSGIKPNISAAEDQPKVNTTASKKIDMIFTANMFDPELVMAAAAEISGVTISEDSASAAFFDQ
jgi:hypothetical protein